MPDTGAEDELDVLAAELYSAPPADFVAARDDAVRAARERGDKDFARAASRLRRPTRAAWMANLLVRYRSEQLDGLLSMAESLADAQRTLDGAALRALSSRRRQLVAAMAREAGRLARQAGESVPESVLRELGDILEAALADPRVAAEVRSGRLTRTVTYAGFGPAADDGAQEQALQRAVEQRATTAAAPEPEPVGQAAPDHDQEQAERERAEAVRAELARERERRVRALEEAEQAEAAAREQREAADAAHEDALAAHDATRDRIAELTAELDAARSAERSAAAHTRTTAADAKTAARDLGAASARTARAQARLDEAPEPA